MAKNVRIYSYFGCIEAENGDLGQTRIKICDNFSSKIVRFNLPTSMEGIVKLAATERHVLLMDDASDGPLWLYRMQTETLFKLPFSSTLDDGFIPIFLPASEISIIIEKAEDDDRLKAQFSHWDDFQRGKWKRAKMENAHQNEQSIQNHRHHFLACTAFGAFLVINNYSGDGAKLLCLFQMENPQFLTDKEPSCSTMEPKSPHSRFLHKLPFHVKKLCAGQDHLALLSPAGHVYTMGTGTKGELGNGRVEKGDWSGPPNLVKPFTEAGIRIVDLECGNWHSIALTDEGDVYGWGWNANGQLGHPHSEFSIQPTPFPFELAEGDIQAVHCAGNSTFMLIGNREYIFGKLQEQLTPIMASTSKETCTENSGKNETTTQSTTFAGQKKEEAEQRNQQSVTSAQELEHSPVPKRPRQQRLLRLAIAGCSHGQMDTIYGRLEETERQRQVKFDLLICCGDFQAIRNHGDLHYYHAPAHHRKLGTFYKYYSGEKVAPVLTLFVGGNHESSGYMAELPNGGWVAPNIYYMGYASVVQFAGLRIAGLSGIYKSGDFERGHFERPPFQEWGSIVSAYHVRSLEIFRLRQLKDSKVDICISHDWPAGVTDFGDREWLLRIKPHFTQDVQYNRLGNPATMNLLYELRPSHWFAAHMHVRFTAVVPHNSANEEEEDGHRQSNSTPETPVTRFLALDKPFEKDSRRRFLEFMDLPIAEDASLELRYDPQWLGIFKATDNLTNFTDKRVKMPDERLTGDDPNARTDFRPTQEEMDFVQNAFGQDDFRIPMNFQKTAPPEREPWNGRGRPASLYYRNPQSQQFCERLGIRDLNLLFAQASVAHLGIPFCIQEENSALSAADQPPPTGNGETNAAGMNNSKNPEEIDLGDDEFGDDDFVVDVKGAT